MSRSQRLYLLACSVERFEQPRKAFEHAGRALALRLNATEAASRTVAGTVSSTVSGTASVATSLGSHEGASIEGSDGAR